MIAACDSRRTPAAETPDERAFSDSILAHLSYPVTLPGHDRVTLTSGEWEGDTTMIGRGSVWLIRSARGELSDGRFGAAVVLLADPGGTGRFFNLVPVQRTAEGPRAGRATALGDRVRPESLWVADRLVHLRLVTHDTADGLCCPTRRELQRFRVVDADSLALEHSELLERLPPDAGGA